MTQLPDRTAGTTSPSDGGLPEPADGVSRRSVMAAAGLGAIGVAIAACSTPAAQSPASSSANSPSGTATSGGPSGIKLTEVSAIPVGGAALARGGGTTWLLAQPSAGNVVCHSGICTHEGCPLTEISGNEGICQCHGSRFNADTGSVVQGPATEPLAAQNVSVSGGEVFLA